MLPQVYSVHICMQPPKCMHRHKGIRMLMDLWHRLADGINQRQSYLVLTPIQVDHKVRTDKYVDLNVYIAIWAVYRGGCALHTLLV